MVEKIAEYILIGLKDAIIGLAKWIVTGIINGSYIICLVACLLALILYVAGIKKAGKYISISFVVYFVLQGVRLLL